MKLNIYQVHPKRLIATRIDGKVFLKYFSFEDQEHNDFLRLREKQEI
jgi:hypothetical protein